MHLLVLLLFGINFSVSKSELDDEKYIHLPSVFHLDNYDECMDLGDKALYCSVTIQLSSSSNNSKTWQKIEEIISHRRNYRHDLLRYGVCVPYSCPQTFPNISYYKENENELKDVISECYTRKYEEIGLKGVVIKMHCEDNEPLYPIDNYDIIVGCCLGALIAIVLLSSLYEGRARYKSEEEYKRITSTKLGIFASCFSIPKNWKRLSKPMNDVNSRKLRVLQGVRFYNMGTVIMAHTCMVLFALPIMNTSYVEAITEKPETMILVNGGYAVQTYFLISGWLLSYHFFQTFEGRKHVNLKFILLAIINRYIRLTPTIMVVMAFSSTWLVHLGRGPAWHRIVGMEYENCRKNWWTNLLYINNYYDVENMCLQQTWYAAADVQLFLISLVIVVLMWKYQNKINLILGTAFGLSLLTVFLHSYFLDLDIIVREYPEALYTILLTVREWRLSYCMGHVNFGGYVIGLYTGYIFYKTKDKKNLHKKIHSFWWWVLTWGPSLSVIYMAWFFYQDGFRSTPFWSALYNALGRNIFAISAATGFYGMTRGLGWIIRFCCEWNPVTYLGRLTFSVYIIHVTLIRIRAGSIRSPSYVTDYLFFTDVAKDMLVSYLFGLVLCLFVEMPVSALQKLMVPQLADTRIAPQESKSTSIQTIETTLNSDNVVSKV